VALWFFGRPKTARFFASREAMDNDGVAMKIPENHRKRHLQKVNPEPP